MNHPSFTKGRVPSPGISPLDSAVGEEDPGAALDITPRSAYEAPAAADPAPAASELIEAPMSPSATPAQKDAHQFADGGGSGGAEAYRTRQDLRGNRQPLGERGAGKKTKGNRAR